MPSRFNLFLYIADQFNYGQFITIQGKRTFSTWTFNDGSPMTYFNWYGPQPDNTSNYLAMKGNHNYQWHDIASHYTGPFLCEKLI